MYSWYFDTCKISEKHYSLLSNKFTKGELKFVKRYRLMTMSSSKITETEVWSRRTVLHPRWALMPLTTDTYRLARSMLLTPNSSSWNKDKQLYSEITITLSGLGDQKYLHFSGSDGVSPTIKWLRWQHN